MPLLDHFQQPLDPRRSWESFHSRWANSLADQLNEVLPQRFFAQVHLHLGSQVEADVADVELSSDEFRPGEENGGRAVAIDRWAPPAAIQTMPAVFPDDLEVHVRDNLDDARLVAVIELVSPRNKDRQEARRAFAAKSAAYLQRGVGLIVLDVIAGRHFNLHDELVRLLGIDSLFLMPADSWLYAVSYRPVSRAGHDVIDVWPFTLAVGSPLPALPLALRSSHAIQLDLEAAYEDACRRSRI